MKLKDIPEFIDGPSVKLKKEVGKVVYTDTTIKRPKHCVRLTNGEHVWWFVDKCKTA